MGEEFNLSLINLEAVKWRLILMKDVDSSLTDNLHLYCQTITKFWDDN